MVNIGIFGMGTVGTGVIEVLENNNDLIYRKTGKEINIKKILVNDLNKERPLKVNDKLTVDAEEILNDDKIQIIVELIGGFDTAYNYIKKALENKKHVITANKDVISRCGKELLQIAKRNNVNLLFEASVGGGIPIIRPLRYCLACNKITKITGILNGTTNYILSKMFEKPVKFEEILSKAQELGYAESDPTADVEGLDAARKLAILSSLAFETEIHPEQIYTEGISNITEKDIIHAKNNGYIIKLLGVSRVHEKGVEARVTPVFLSENHPLSNVMGVYNSIMIEGYPIGEVMFYGQGAGKEPTANAVISDLMEVINDGGKHKKYNIGVREIKLMNMANIKSEFYIRAEIPDGPDVESKLGNILRDNNLNIKSMQMKKNENGNSEIILFTKEAKYDDIVKTSKRLEDKHAFKIYNIIRCEGDD